MAKSDGRSSRAWKALCQRLQRDREPVCWICGEAIDLWLPRNDRMAWTADHVLSLDEHPEIDPLDELNIKPAHRYCNSKKGARSYAGQVKASRVW
jgi:5-methylcytosine-specific restriction endonuclease McrA